MPKALPFLRSPRRRSVLSRAVARWRAGNYNAVFDALVDESGNGLHARLGSAVGTDTNDPLRLSYDGRYAYLPGNAGDRITTPDSATFSAFGDFDVRALVSLTDWTPAADNTIAGHWYDTGNKRSWYFGVSTIGRLYLSLSADGTAASFYNSTVAPTVSDGQKLWIRVTRATASGNVLFYTSADGVTWNQLGATVAGFTGTLFNSDQVLSIGAHATGSLPLQGNVYYVEVRSSIGGTVVASMAAAQLAEPFTSYTDPQGNVWTLNRSASGRKLCVVDRDILLLGGDDYLEVPDHQLIKGNVTGFTFVSLARAYGTPIAFSRQLTKKDNSAVTNPGWNVEHNNTAQFVISDIGDGSNRYAQAASAWSSGMFFASGGVLAGSTNRAINPDFSLSAPIAIAGPINNSVAMRFGCTSPGSGAFFDGEFVAAAIFLEPLNAADLLRLKREWGILS